jgi:hypothetical protein
MGRLRRTQSGATRASCIGPLGPMNAAAFPQGSTAPETIDCAPPNDGSRIHWSGPAWQQLRRKGPRDDHGRIARDQHAKSEFKKMHLPGNGKVLRRLPRLCHWSHHAAQAWRSRRPAQHLQWQTNQAANEKDSTESAEVQPRRTDVCDRPLLAGCCRRHTRATGETFGFGEVGACISGPAESTSPQFPKRPRELQCQRSQARLHSPDITTRACSRTGICCCPARSHAYRRIDVVVMNAPPGKPLPTR